MGILIYSFLLSFITIIGQSICAHDDVVFDKNYHVVWAPDYTQLLNQSTGIELAIDQASGCAFQSNNEYGSGLFHIRLKLSKNDTTGILTAFYLRSYEDAHDEIDFEFPGADKPPYKLNTNIFANGQGNREQVINLWFDPTEDFHSYTMLYNQYQIVFFVDDFPIRVFRNNSNSGLNYLTQAMKIEGSMWNPDWLSPRRPVNWTQGPFKAQYFGFEINGCQANQSSNPQDCQSPKFRWNEQKYWSLDNAQLKTLRGIRRKYMTYDYCNNTKDPNISLECLLNQ